MFRARTAIALTGLFMALGLQLPMSSRGDSNPQEGLSVASRLLKLAVAGDGRAAVVMEGNALRADVEIVTGKVTDIQAYQNAIPLKEGAIYTLKYRAKASAPRGLGVGLKLDEGDFHPVCHTDGISLSSEWQEFTKVFQVVGSRPDHTRLEFDLGGQTGTVWLSDIHLTPGEPVLKPGKGLLPAVTDFSGWDVAIGGRLTTESAWQPGIGGLIALTADGAAARVLISQVSSPATCWAALVGHANLKENTKYILRFRAKAEPARDLWLWGEVEKVGGIPNGMDYHAALTPEWKEFTAPFTAKPGTTGRNLVPEFQVSQRTGVVWVSDVTLMEAAASSGSAVGDAATPGTNLPTPNTPLVPPGRAILPNGSFDYRFDGRMSRGVLENYLARAITESHLLHGRGSSDDNTRMLKNMGAKFVGMSILLWGSEASLPQLLTQARQIAAKVHRADPDIILQAGEFEIVTRQVDQLPIPEWVFKEFSLPVETRHFRYEDMIYVNGEGKDRWGREMSVPDMSRPETQMWFFYLAASYIDAGVEAIRFGQVHIMDSNDKDHTIWFEELARIRHYASLHARRHFVLCNAHSTGIARDGKLLFDAHASPLRIAETTSENHEGELRMGFNYSLYGFSMGGVTPSGWACEHLPYLVEFDNYGTSGHEGQNWHEDGNPFWVWGYDEIGWFAHQSEAYRNQWLGYAWNWVRGHDANAYVEMPGSRTLATPVSGNVRWYWANTASSTVPSGFNQEQAIKALWAKDTPTTARR